MARRQASDRSWTPMPAPEQLDVMMRRVLCANVLALRQQLELDKAPGCVTAWPVSNNLITNHQARGGGWQAGVDVMMVEAGEWCRTGAAQFLLLHRNTNQQQPVVPTASSSPGPAEEVAPRWWTGAQSLMSAGGGTWVVAAAGIV